MAPTRLLTCAVLMAALTLGLASASAATGGQQFPWNKHVRLTSKLAHGVCTVAGLPQPRFGSSALVVPSGPTGLTLDWTPGLNDRSCKVVRTSDRSSAKVLVHDINAAPLVPNAAQLQCPFDDDTGVMLSFTYSKRTLAPVMVKLNGCGWIFTSGSEMRQLTPKVRTDLTGLVPPRWRAYVAG